VEYLAPSASASVALRRCGFPHSKSQENYGTSVKQFKETSPAPVIGYNNSYAGSSKPPETVFPKFTQVSVQILHQLVQEYGIPLAEVTRQLGVSTSAISNAVKLVNYIP
jgi:hypothetical protein